MQHIRQVRPSDASGDVPVRRWKRFKRRVDELPEPELFGSDDGAPAVPFTSSQCEVYNTLDSMDCLLDAVKVADFMGDDEKMTMLATAAMTRCDFCLLCVLCPMYADCKTVSSFMCARLIIMANLSERSHALA